MVEYITGRIKLSNCGADKNIGEVKAKEKKMQLSFILDEDGKIVVDQVPGVYGVRCDSVVEGFIKGETKTIRPVDFPTTSKCKKERKCTLNELMEHNGISKANDTLVFETGVTYCAHYMKVDTKDFGLPIVQVGLGEGEHADLTLLILQVRAEDPHAVAIELVLGQVKVSDAPAARFLYDRVDDRV